MALAKIPANDATTIERLSHEKLLQLKQRLGLENNGPVLIIIDEISMVTPTFLAIIDCRLRQVTGIDKSFGGVPVHLIGDFSQIPPVNGITITEAVLAITERDINSERFRFNKENLPENHLPIIRRRRRARNTSTNSETLPSKYNPNTLFRRGVQLLTESKWVPLTQQTRSTDDIHTEFITHIANGGAISMEKLKTYKALTSEDMSSPKWRFAPILVSTN